MLHDGIIIHYAEVATKGRNRPRFINRLAANVQRVVGGLPYNKIRILSGRFWLPAKERFEFDDELSTRLRNVIGLTSWSPALRSELEMEAMKKAAWEIIEPLKYETFRVTSRRVFKDLPYRSIDVNMDVGEYILERREVPVKMKGADVEVYIEMMPGRAYIYAQKIKGRGGLPVGMTGPVTVLLSGGIDSPVAAYRMQKRGCTVELVHFHAVPFLSPASKDKAIQLAQRLAEFQGKVFLHMVPIGELQREVVENCPASLRVILYRRFMVRLAERIAKKNYSQALITGEALAQVASQTLSNLASVDAVTQMPVLRPLIGYDKSEIIEEAQDLDTFKISIQPDQDCCTLFMPRDPATKSRVIDVERAEAVLDVEALVEDALAREEKHLIKASWKEVKIDTDTDTDT
ncbi:tRNA 4-thiouridine(8) synthase ThiI, partial [Myxococcota bacterium]|nr:tRNA 4-thiouridine(8) synthase ThiI [Myxococcota bacterium]